MILELADIRIHPDKQAEFDAAIVKGVETVISKAKGFRGYKVNKGVESPERYVLIESGPTRCSLRCGSDWRRSWLRMWRAIRA